MMKQQKMRYDNYALQNSKQLLQPPSPKPMVTESRCTTMTSSIRRHQTQRFQIVVVVAAVLRQLEMTTERFPCD